MKLSTLTITAIFSSLIFFSCNNTSKENEGETTEIASKEEDHHENDHENEAIVLNNGEKWKVDANMMPHIRNMEKDILDFATDEKKDYKSLAKKLQSNIDLLTSNCTMEGQAHDELHKWLLPYIDLVDELSKVKDDIKATKQFEYIQTSFSTFNQYFK